MHRIIILWSTPRTTSTAFEWMMRMRGDMTCFHEPFGEAWYKGDDAACPRLTPQDTRIPGLSAQVVLNRMLVAAQERPVFSKDMPHYIEHIADGPFLSHFTHSFLIRDPEKAIPSIYSRAPHWDLKEFGFKDHRWLFDKVTEHNGRVPPVIDSDDLLSNPHGTIAAWCKAVEIPFIPEALSWKPGNRDQVSWYDSGSWHDALKNSDGLKPQPRTYGDIASAPAAVKEIYDMALPHYQHLYAHRLQPK